MSPPPSDRDDSEGDKSRSDRSHRDNLVDHFAAFATSQREDFARLYDAPAPTPEALATTVLENPNALRVVVEREILPDADARSVLEQLAFEHDLYIDLSWAGRSARRALRNVGVLAPAPREAPPHHNRIPAAIAAVVAPLLGGVPATVVTLLGAEAPDQIDRVVQAWGIEAPSRIERILKLSAHLADPARVDDLVFTLGAPEYLGSALMTLELGGVCYWQEVFGHDLDQNPEFGSNVVALMPSDERDLEKAIADTLIEHGVIFRVQDPGRSPLVVVPEELWSTLWTLGRNSLVEWIAIGFDGADQAVRRSGEAAPAPGPAPGPARLQPALKWLTCEATLGTLECTEAGELTDAAAKHIVDVADRGVDYWADRVRLALELSAVRPSREGRLVAHEGFRAMLDLPHSTFVRQVLFDWCTGYVGSAADAELVNAFSVDDVWRREVVAALSERGEFVGLWMQFEGVEPQKTGCGYLRRAGDSDPDLLMVEVGLTNGLVWSAKLVWLDLLSLLESGMWYPVSFLTELLQLSAGLAIFTQLIHVLEQPNLGYYLPVQRASFVAGEFRASEFDAWVAAIVRGLLEPLGVGRLSDDGDFVWLETSALRVESPPGLPDGTREQLMREIFADESLEFRVPAHASGRLHPIDELPDGPSIAMERPFDEILEWLGDRPISKFDGRAIWVS